LSGSNPFAPLRLLGAEPSAGRQKKKPGISRAWRLARKFKTSVLRRKVPVDLQPNAYFQERWRFPLHSHLHIDHTFYHTHPEQKRNLIVAPSFERLNRRVWQTTIEVVDENDQLFDARIFQ
jgi:hypothetical protein